MFQKKRSSIAVDRLADLIAFEDDNQMRAESKLTLARDSLEMLRASTEKLVQASKVVSKLELARDSLEIIKQTSRMSFSEQGKISEAANSEELRKAYQKHGMC